MDALERNRRRAISSIGAALLEVSKQPIDAKRAGELATRILDHVRDYGEDVFHKLIKDDDDTE